MTTASVIRVHRPGVPPVLDSTRVTPPRPGEVRVEVLASGMCGADVGTARAQGGDVSLPVTPGHEVAGRIAELGPHLAPHDALGPGSGFAGSGVRWQVGDRVAVGWFGGSCGHCGACLSGDVVHCPERKVPGLSYPGGWAQFITVPVDALARIPDGLDLADAAPMGCAGVTTFNALREARLLVPARVAVFGLGGLGHLAVQFAVKMGYETIVIARGAEREETARSLGAHHYVDSHAGDPAERLQELGGVDLLVSTASSTDEVSGLVRGLRVGGRLVLLGVDAGTVTVPAAHLVMKGCTVGGHLTGTPRDIEDAMRFAVTTGVRPVLERVPLADAPQALERLAAGQARFRIVLEPQASSDSHQGSVKGSSHA